MRLPRGSEATQPVLAQSATGLPARQARRSSLRLESRTGRHPVKRQRLEASAAVPSLVFSFGVQEVLWKTPF